MLEWIAAGFGLVTTFLYVRQNIWCWPLGMVAVLLYFFIMLDAKLYTDMVSQLILFGLQIYGWRMWLHGGEEHGHIAISSMTLSLLFKIILFMLITTVIIGYGLDNYTDGQLVYWDTFKTLGMLVGQWLIARKILQCWLWFAVINVMHVVIYIYAGLLVTAGLWFIYFGLALYGIWLWQKDWRGQLSNRA